MTNLQERFQEVQKSKDPEEFNNFLIEISKNLTKESSTIVRAIVNDLELDLLEKIKLNLVYVIGELGEKYSIENSLYNFLLDSYFNSDRWIREEILQALIKISKTLSYTEALSKILKFALNEDYKPIKLKALKILQLLGKIPHSFIIILLKLLGSADSEIDNISIQLFQSLIPNEKTLFEYLNSNHNYQLLNKNNIRILLITYLNSVSDIEVYMKKINAFSWEKKFKDLFIDEMNIYRRILTRKF